MRRSVSGSTANQGMARFARRRSPMACHEHPAPKQPANERLRVFGSGSLVVRVRSRFPRLPTPKRLTFYYFEEAQQSSIY